MWSMKMSSLKPPMRRSVARSGRSQASLTSVASSGIAWTPRMRICSIGPIRGALPRASRKVGPRASAMGDGSLAHATKLERVRTARAAACARSSFVSPAPSRGGGAPARRRAILFSRISTPAIFGHVVLNRSRTVVSVVSNSAQAPDAAKASMAIPYCASASEDMACTTALRRS